MERIQRRHTTLRRGSLTCVVGCTEDRLERKLPPTGRVQDGNSPDDQGRDVPVQMESASEATHREFLGHKNDQISGTKEKRR